MNKEKTIHNRKKLDFLGKNKKETLEDKRKGRKKSDNVAAVSLQ
jgi:hypothetical protein